MGSKSSLGVIYSRTRQQKGYFKHASDKWSSIAIKYYGQKRFENARTEDCQKYWMRGRRDEVPSPMNPVLIAKPSRVAAAGNKPKLIDEYIGRVNSGTHEVSVAQMRSPGGWTEPGQTPDFEEYTVVLRGVLRVEYGGGMMDIEAGQAVIAPRGEWVRYSTPGTDGAEYIAVCTPAFTLDAAHRDPEW
jgi:mannose-6-phosphate isomerase-like protein (cupin superfamily)